MSKNFAVAGASAQESSAAMYQLNQALASGRLQGDEYRSTIENAPLLAQSIEAYMRDAGVEGTLKEWASEGLLTAEVIKGALFSSADEIERRFASMPMTFAQVGNAAANALLKAFDPAIQAFGRSAQYIYENWDRLAPLIYGAAAAVAAYVLAANAANIANAIAIIRSGLMSLALAAQAVGYFVLAAATGSAAASMAALNALMMANPILLIVAAIGLIVYLIVRWIQKVGGLRIAWLIMQDAILSALANLKIFGMEVWDALIGKIQGFISETLVDFQNWYNIVAGLLNKLIEGINTVSGLSIPTLPTATFGDKVSQDFERNNRMREYNIANEKRQASLDRIDRQNAIVEAQTSTAQGDEDVVQNVERIANNTAAALDYSEEEIKLWRDIAERDTINRFTTAEVSVSFGDVNNNVSSGVDLDGIIDYIAEKTEEALLVTAAGVHYDGV
jgi:tape measure domain-containing protein